MYRVPCCDLKCGLQYCPCSIWIPLNLIQKTLLSLFLSLSHTHTHTDTHTHTHTHERYSLSHTHTHTHTHNTAALPERTWGRERKEGVKFHSNCIFQLKITVSRVVSPSRPDQKRKVH